MRVVAVLAGLSLVAVSALGGEGVVRRTGRPVSGNYIVVLEKDASLSAVSSTARNFAGAKIRHSYSRGIKGFSLQATAADATRLSRDPRVAFIEEDSYVSAATTWGLDRIDQRLLPLDGIYAPDASGAGVTVFVVDTGIQASHPEFGSRVAAGFSAFDDGRGTEDCHGHGTHVAGIAGGATYGVAPSVTLVPVRVLDCTGSGTVSSVLAGLEWILAQPAGPAVVNMSFGGPLSSAVDLEVATLVANGLTTVAAAGNGSEDACRTSPARVPEAITVGATTSTDARASFSNYGTCVDVFAPGVSIISASLTGGSAAGSGTSSSAPFVAGTAALLLETYPHAAPAAVAATLQSNATPDVVTAVGTGSPNRLLFAKGTSLAQPAPAIEQLLADPGFEYGTDFWSSSICAVIKPTGCIPDEEYIEVLSASPRGGVAHAAVGGPSRGFQLTSEAVTIPANVAGAELAFYLWVVTKDRSALVSDVLRVQILDAHGAVLETVGTFSNLDAGTAWLRREFDISRYAGQTIRVSFSGDRAVGAPTWFQLDDVTLNVRR